MLELADLPQRLTRNSLEYYYLSVWPGLLQLEPLGPDAPRPVRVESGYLHFPFCSGLCDFCSYFVVVSRDPARDGRIGRHVDDLLLEIDLNQERFEIELSYLYLGGGTPSLLPSEQLDRLFAGLQSRGALAEQRVGTVEVHPEFFEDEQRAGAFLDVVQAHGITRVSVGFQTADDALLEHTNRRHRSDFAGRAVEYLQSRGFTVNLDLMYGLPDQSVESWVVSLETVLALAPDSVSTYFMFLDPGTPLWREVDRGAVALPSHELVQTQHLAAQLVLEQGGLVELPGDFWCKVDGDPAAFTQTALPSEGNSLGLGAGAYGYYADMQYFNHFSLTGYRKMLQERRVPLWRGAVLSAEQHRCRDIMFSLKNSPCLRLDLFTARHGVSPLDTYPEVFDLLLGLDLVRVDSQTVRLTLKGRLLVEEIACLFEPAGHHAAARRENGAPMRLRRHNFAPTYSAGASRA